MKNDVIDCKDMFETVCKIGLVTRDKTKASLVTRQRESRSHTIEYRIPHLLILDYLAAVYLASIHHVSPPEFESNLKKLIAGSRNNIDKFEYLWYFTVGQSSAVGKKALDVLLHEIDNRDFIIRIAFECCGKDVAIPAMKMLLSFRALRLAKRMSLAAFLYATENSPETLLVR